MRVSVSRRVLGCAVETETYRSMRYVALVVSDSPRQSLLQPVSVSPPGLGVSGMSPLGLADCADPLSLDAGDGQLGRLGHSGARELVFAGQASSTRGGDAL